MVTKTELEKRDQQLEELTVRYNRECVKRQHTELERDNVTTELVYLLTYPDCETR